MCSLSAVQWLSYVPVSRKHSLPILLPPFADPVDRPIDFHPTKAPYDPRHMLAGVNEVVIASDSGVSSPSGAAAVLSGSSMDASSVWRSGFLDRDSWTELLGGWARTAIVGRGRLGGIPVGVIAVETRTVEQVIPADPAAPDSKEVIQQRAGQVWYPDSAFKVKPK